MKLFLGEKDLCQPRAEPPHQQENAYAAKGGGQHAQDRALYRAEGVARGDLKGLAGDHRHHHLKDHHAHIGQTPAEAVGIHPAPESLRLRGKADKRYAHQPYQQNGDHDSDADGDQPQTLLLRGRQFISFHICILYRYHCVS